MHAVFAGARLERDRRRVLHICVGVRKTNCCKCLHANLDAITACVSLPRYVQGVILFDVSDKKWTLDLSSGAGSLKEGDTDNADLTLTMNDENFAKLVSGKLNPQQVRQNNCTRTVTPIVVVLVVAHTLHQVDTFRFGDSERPGSEMGAVLWCGLGHVSMGV